MKTPSKNNYQRQYIYVNLETGEKIPTTQIHNYQIVRTKRQLKIKKHGTQTSRTIEITVECRKHRYIQPELKF